MVDTQWLTRWVGMVLVYLPHLCGGGWEGEEVLKTKRAQY